MTSRSRCKRQDPFSTRCPGHGFISNGRCCDTAGVASPRSYQPRHQAAAVVLSRHDRAAMATLGLLRVNVAPHSLAPRSDRERLDECRRTDRCRAVMGLPPRLGCRPQLQCGQRCRSFSLVCAASAQDVCAITHLQSPWRVYPSSSMLPPSHGRRSSGQIRCLSYSSVWKRSASSANASVDSGGTQTIEQLWEEYFADASQWWDNRVDKKNLRSPDFKHKVRRKALWIDGWSTPAWVKARLTPVTESRLQSHVGSDTRDFQDTAQGQRPPVGDNAEGITLPTRATKWRQIVQGGGGSMDVQSASTTTEAIAILKYRLQQGIPIKSNMYVDVLRRCLKQKDLLAVKQVHDCIIKSGMDQNAYVRSSLLSVYIRCGRLQDARRVFDGLLKKNVISWNVMIGGYAQHNHARDAMEVFQQMRQENVEADEITYLSILKACAGPSALKWGKVIHAYIRQEGLESDVRVGTALLQMYAKCGCIKEARQTFENLTNRNVYSWNVMIGAYAESGSIDDARLLFDRMEERDVITWNVMLGGLAQHGCGDEAYRLFLQMKRECFKPDAITYVSILNARASAGALEWVKEVHGHALEARLESDLRVGNALVHMYGKSGSIDDARLVFDRMEERDRITWTVMIGAYAESGCGEEAYRLFLQMKRDGFKPDAITYVSLLNARASAGALEWVKEVHGHALEAGLESDLRVGNALVDMYAKSGSIGDARLVFDRMEDRDLITWTVMIGAYAESGCGEEAYQLFLQMKRDGFKPDAITYVSILNARASAGALEWVKDVHGHVLEAGLQSDLRVGNALVHMYARGGSIDDARLVFDRMEERHRITWTVMIGAYAEIGCGEEAYRLLVQMKRDGFKPDAVTYVSILNARASAEGLDWVKEVHGHALEAGLESDLRVGNALVHMYAKSSSVDDARLVFDRMDERDVITWTVMIGAYARSGCGGEAYRLFLHMRREGFKPDAITYLSILNACASAGALDWVKEVHRHVLEAGLESDLRVGNVLVHMYAKCGSIDDALLVFDRMVERDVITWNVMIGAFAGSGSGEEAYRLFLQMRREGFKPDAVTYVSILNACASAGALDWVKEVHGHALEAGLGSDLRVGSALVHMYAKCGSIDDARLVFDRMKERDVISWNVMIGAYAESGCGEEAYRLFLEMKRDGFKPNAMTYVSILNARASSGALEWVKEVQGHALEAGLESDLHVGNGLVHMYAKVGSIGEARLVFDNMEERDVITWTVMIGAYAESGSGEEAYRLFLQMKREGFEPNPITYVSILNACASVGALEWVKDVHGYALEAGLESDLRVGSALVRMYAKSGSIGDARLVFERMEERDVISWTVMIGAYAEIGCGEEAYRLFLGMKRDGFKPDAVTFVSILNARASAGALEWVKDVHGHTLAAGLELDLRVGNALVHMYAKCGCIDEARLIFDRMEERDLITWNVMIGAYAESSCGEEAYRLFLQMKGEGFKADAITYLSILNACASAGALDWVKEVHGHVLEAGLESDLRVGNVLVHMYAKCGSIDDALLVFDRMVERDVITWNVMIGAFAGSGSGEEAYRLFLQMRREGFKPDAVTYVSILNACASAGALDWVKEVHGHALEAGLGSDLRVGSALVHMYAKCGSIDDARLVFDGMEDRDVITWNVMIGGLAQHGYGLEALELFRRMNADGFEPDVWSLVAVLSACSHAGLVDDGRVLFLAMTQDYGIKPNIFLCNCMVDLLGRAGQLEEALLFIRTMPVEPDVATWGALLGACRTYGNVELAEVAAKESLKLERSHAGTYVLLSNVYAAAGKWDQVSLVRTMMLEKGLRKEPGRSWIEVDSKIHGFVVGDTSHPETKEIYAELNKLTDRIKAAGYIPDTRLVLQNVDEEDKELALCSHSEKLAIAYGLMRTPHGKPIRVYKNLRVCSDCHTATKFISKVTGREIVARDANRFHHFNDGVCSCGDYW